MAAPGGGGQYCECQGMGRDRVGLQTAVNVDADEASLLLSRSVLFDYILTLG